MYTGKIFADMCGKEKISKRVQWQINASSGGSVNAPIPIQVQTVGNVNFDQIFFTSELETWFVKNARISYWLQPSLPNPTNLDQHTFEFNFRFKAHKHLVTTNFEDVDNQVPSAMFDDSEYLFSFNKYNQSIEFPLDTLCISGIRDWVLNLWCLTTLRTNTNSGITGFTFRATIDFEIYRYRE